MGFDDLHPGLRHSQSLRIDAGLTVPCVSAAFTGFADMPSVFATAFMVGFVEWTCIEALRPYLSGDQRTVGTHIDMSHIGATPVGMQVRADVELVTVEGRRLRFQVECRDDVELIGQGFHERAIIDLPRFSTRLDAKSRAIPTI